MISSSKALEIILAHSLDFGSENVPITVTNGRILKERIYADRDFPPFDRVMMDGIALNFKHFISGQRVFQIDGIQGAGDPQLTLQKDAHCLEVMTGAICPANTDTIIPYELIDIVNGNAHLNYDKVKKGQHIHLKGTDRKTGELLIDANTVISAAEIGIFATVGCQSVAVAKLPKVLIISTGDELVEVGEKPQVHQIRRSNVFSLMGMLKALQINADEVHLNDDKKELRMKMQGYLSNYDVIMSSGGVSKGKFDFLPEVFEELKVKKLFHKIAQRPGKPFWFGIKNQTCVFAFPGNPVSTYMCAAYYFTEWLAKSLGHKRPSKRAILTTTFSFAPQLTYFLQVAITYHEGCLMATPIVGKGSGDLANLAESDAFMILPAEKDQFKKGEHYPIISYR